jgi:hypothetical protein
MDILYIVMALIVGVTGVIPANTQPVVASSFDLEVTNSVINGVNPVDTIITPKPEPESKKAQSKEVTVQTKTSFYASVEAELSNIPAQGSCFDYVPEMSSKYGVDADLMARIIKAESGGNPLAKNKNSTASGCGQFIRSTWAGTLRQMGREWVTPFDAKTNVEAMAFKISRGGIGAWNASKSKWSK